MASPLRSPIVAAVLFLELPLADLHVPFDYGGDALLYALITKSVVAEADAVEAGAVE
jgi:hypothetical protein